ncbi:uncharacterized protein LOC114260964 isoform X1 [Camellia sinensis]|uniref:uncharacterized protein LOC114260964 isoform X1 n=1 Tax=Camellia sinensis TaxID=4442 RepID=UPI001036C62F|nr:uncharacterized protein LOC114260964 isoform X1 [Camellia sinensis]
MESDPSLLYQDSDAWNKFHSRHSSGKVFKIFMLSALPLHRMPTAIAACFSVLKPGGLLLFRDYGELPNCWEHFNSLYIFSLAYDNLHGEIPSSMGSLCELETLHLHNNGAGFDIWILDSFWHYDF